MNFVVAGYPIETKKEARYPRVYLDIGLTEIAHLERISAKV